MRDGDLLELNRRFLPVSKDHASWLERQERLQWSSARTLGWPDLLSLPSAVVLGEAGAGKTAELKRAAAQLASARKTSFFVPVEEVAARGLTASLDINQRGALRQWRETNEDGWFLLDSVDESKLKRRSLAAAINALSEELEAEVSRVRLVLSSRASDWRTSDEAIVSALRPHLAGGSVATPDDLFIFELAPLDRERIGCLARHHNLVGSELEAFLAAARDADAWSFLERPLDVLALVAHWKRHRRLGTYREVVATSIEAKLAEKPERESNLTPARARSGAQKLALASVLAQASAFLLPGEQPDELAGEALTPATLLPDWSDAELKDLLSRGLFDEATYGRVRIHHRQAQEYLAADELLLMLAQGMPKHDLECLLFRDSHGAPVTPSHLQSVTAWCSLQSADVRRRALQIIPEHLLDRGDPSELPPEDRRSALLAYVARFRKTSRVFHNFDHFGLKRFACLELAATISSLLDAPDIPEHIKLLLLELVEHGRIELCAKAALRIALLPSVPTYLRIAAIRATAGAGSDEDRTELLNLVGRDDKDDRRVAGVLIRLLYPKQMDDEVLHTLVRGAPPPTRRSSDELEAFLLRTAPQICSPDQRRALIEMLTEHVARTQGSDGESHVQRSRHWLIEPLTALIALHLQDPKLPEQVREEALAIIETCCEDYTFQQRHSLGILDKDHGLRATLFWRRVHAHLREEGTFPPSPYHVRMPYPLRLDEADMRWLKADCLDRRDIRERLLAIVALWELAAPRDDAAWKFVSHVAIKSDARYRTAALQKRLVRWKARSTHVPPQPWELESRARQLAEQKQHAETHAWFRKNLELIRSGHWGALEHLYWACPGDTGTERSDRLSIEDIAKKYDSDVAEAARQGFVAFWRSHEPHRVEDEPTNTIYDACCVGLAGLALDVAQGTDITALSDELFRRALTYALWEMSSLPPWLEHCAETRPKDVAQIFAPMLELDFNAPTEKDEKTGRVLYKLPRESLAVRTACAPQLAELLRHCDPPRTSTLKDLLRTIVGTNTLTEIDLIALAKSRASSSETDPPRFAVWWSELLIQSPTEAIESLAAATSRTNDPEPLTRTLLDALASHLEGRDDQRLERLRRDPISLAKLCDLVVTHAPRRDLDSSGDDIAGAASEELRRRLPIWLAAVDDSQATVALRNLASRTDLPAREREWLQHLADVRAVADVSKPMASDELQRFMTSQIVEPETAAQLFKIIKNRLSDIQHGLTNDDFSLRLAFNPKKEWVLEEVVQNFFARELENNRRGQYNVARELEVAGKKKPDIRAFNQRCGGPVTLEIKVAQGWSVTALEEGLEKQLVGQYMRANNSTFGLYVVCSSGPKESWPLPDGSAVNFSGLIARLATKARLLRERTPSIQGLDVVPIDFH